MRIIKGNKLIEVDRKMAKAPDFEINSENYIDNKKLKGVQNRLL
ncbi:MAG: hypothetical protein VZR28_01750 [Candidatus Cryptobacteroides sp.]|nr:hypothetical protein [Candidatus Cryptobacteroides sp.]MEE3429418.1 hypothetical protein [Candidatus Cryptobacteroides sp.]